PAPLPITIKQLSSPVMGGGLILWLFRRATNIPPLRGWVHQRSVVSDQLTANSDQRSAISDQQSFVIRNL
ncbi:MAG: hypothetical protein KA053_08400, partial [Lentimicrobiaceae bacterium]|nr:hypothetical protein [Lentimicrobiaceae bacterium]